MGAPRRVCPQGHYEALRYKELGRRRDLEDREARRGEVLRRFAQHILPRGFVQIECQADRAPVIATAAGRGAWMTITL